MSMLQGVDAAWCRQIHAHREAEAKERQAEMELLSADPFDPEVQARIAERIRQAQVEENYQTAYEYMPESFSQVTMLYVDMEVRPYAEGGAACRSCQGGRRTASSGMNLKDLVWLGHCSGGPTTLCCKLTCPSCSVQMQRMPCRGSDKYDMPAIDQEERLGVCVICVDLLNDAGHLCSTLGDKMVAGVWMRL